MNTRCPNCGAVHSLDTLIGHDDAARLLKLVLDLDADIGRAAVRYIGLFRPEKSQLGFGRVARLLEEILPDMQAGEIRRGGLVVQTSPQMWTAAFGKCLEARDAGRLKTPLKSHGYLYEILAGMQDAPPPAPPAQAAQTASPPQSKLRGGVMQLSEWMQKG